MICQPTNYLPCIHTQSYNKAKNDMASALKILNQYLSTKTFLVGDSITLADIVVACTLVYPFKLVADEEFVKPYANVMKWFNTCVTQNEFARVIGQVQLCKKEMKAQQ